MQWSKLINNCAYNALSAVAGIAYGEMFKVQGVPDIVTNAVVECMAVARACGVSLPADLLDKTLALAASMPLQQSSTSQDLARGKPSEIDFLNGFIVRKGAEHGIPTPTNHALQVMVKLVERSGSRRVLAAHFDAQACPDVCRSTLPPPRQIKWAQREVKKKKAATPSHFLPIRLGRESSGLERRYHTGQTPDMAPAGREKDRRIPDRVQFGLECVK